MIIVYKNNLKIQFNKCIKIFNYINEHNIYSYTIVVLLYYLHNFIMLQFKLIHNNNA